MNKKQWSSFAFMFLILSVIFWFLGIQAYGLTNLDYTYASDASIIRQALIYNRTYFFESLGIIFGGLAFVFWFAGSFEKEEGKKK